MVSMPRQRADRRRRVRRAGLQGGHPGHPPARQPARAFPLLVNMLVLAVDGEPDLHQERPVPEHEQRVVRGQPEAGPADRPGQEPRGCHHVNSCSATRDKSPIDETTTSTK